MDNTNESIFNFNNRFQMAQNLKLCKTFYESSIYDDNYCEMIKDLENVMSNTDKPLLEIMPNLSADIFPLVKYVYMSICSYLSLLSSDSEYIRETVSSEHNFINITKFGYYMQYIRSLLQKHFLSQTSIDRPFSSIYPLQDKNILFDTELLYDCFNWIETEKIDYLDKEILLPITSIFSKIVKMVRHNANRNLTFS